MCVSDRLAAVNLDQENLRRKNDELAQAYKEKSRKLSQTQELYDKLKRKAMLGQMQDAAEDAVDSTLQAAAVGAPPYGDAGPNQTMYQDFGTPFRRPHPNQGEMSRGAPAYPPAAARQTHNTSWPRTMGARGQGWIIAVW